MRPVFAAIVASGLTAGGEAWAYVLWAAPLEPWSFAAVLMAGPVLVGVGTYVIERRLRRDSERRFDEAADAGASRALGALLDAIRGWRPSGDKRRE